MEPSKYIRVSYELTGFDGEKHETIEIATRENPFIFVSGLGVSLDTFESQITSLQTGDKFDFTLQPEEAYGERDDDAVTEVPKNIFEVDGKVDTRYIYEGAIVPLMNADGQRFNGLIVKMGKESVTIDLNHPLAGMSLNFKGEIIESREATKEEISGTIKMLAGEGCGGGCGSCGGGCGNCGEGCEEGSCSCGESECRDESGCKGGCGGCK